MNEMAIVFDHDVSGQEAAMKLTCLRQGNETVADFSISFRALAGKTGWAEGPLRALFLNALTDSVKDALAPLEPPASFNALVSTTIRIDNRLRERGRERGDRRDRPSRHVPPFEPFLPCLLPSFLRITLNTQLRLYS